MPGPHKVDVSQHAHELFEIEKVVMAHSPYLYQFSSIEEFIKCLTEDHNCSTYIWNSEEGITVGFFVHENLSEEKDVDELMLIVVLPDFQGKSYGQKMMHFYLDLLRNKKKSIIFTHEKNNGAIRFYESFGYKLIKKVPNKYTDGQTRVLLEKILIGGDGGS